MLLPREAESGEDDSQSERGGGFTALPDLAAKTPTPTLPTRRFAGGGE